MATVSLDARLTRQMSVGMKTYVRELVARLPRAAPDLTFVVVTNDDAVAASAAGGCTVLRLGERAAANVSWGEQTRLPRLMRQADFAHYLSVYAPRWSPLPYAYTIHDLIHRRYPGYFSWKIPPYYALVAGPVARGARVVITDARSTSDDLRSYLRVAADRVQVIPLGVSEAFALDDADRASRAGAARAAFGIERPFILYAGNHRPHKNLETLAAAWSALAEPCDLVVTEDGPLSFALDRFVKSNGRIVLTGHIGVDQLVDLYAACAATAQPSLYEGFGLSVLEAMSAGAPVVVAQTSALLEVADDAALSFPATDAGALRACLTRMLGDTTLANDLRARGRARAARYSWDRTAKLTAQVYRACVGP